MRTEQMTYPFGMHAGVIGVAIALCFLSSCAPGATESAASAQIEASPFAAVAKGRIDIEGGTIRLAAQRDGLVRQVFVEEGDLVKKGQALATLESSAAELNVRTAKIDLDQTRAQVPVAEARDAAARREVERLRPLAETGAISQLELAQAQDAMRIAAAELNVARTNVQGAQRRLSVQSYEIEARTIRAPLDGRIVRRSAKPGDGTSTLNVTELFLLAPEAPRIVRAELDEQFVAAVQPGQSVNVSLEFDPTRKFTGKVLRIGQVFGMAKNRSDDPNAAQDVRVVELVTSIQGGEDLRIGQRVLVQVNK